MTKQNIVDLILEDHKPLKSVLILMKRPVKDLAEGKSFLDSMAEIPAHNRGVGMNNQSNQKKGPSTSSSAQQSSGSRGSTLSNRNSGNSNASSSGSRNSSSGQSSSNKQSSSDEE